MENCCSLTLANTGVGCTPIMDVIKKFIFVPRYKADGTLNQINVTDVFNQAYFDALVNNTNPTNRIYPTPLLKGVIEEEADPEYETHPDGTKQKTRDGIKTLNWMITSQDNNPGAVSPRMKGKIDAWGCGEKSVYGVSKTGQLIGYTSEAGYIAPLPYDSGSFKAKMPKSADAASQKITGTFEWSPLLLDSMLVTIEPSELGGANLLGLKGLIDVTSTISNITTTGFKAKLVTEYGTPVSPLVVKGLLAADFAIQNVTDTAPVTIVTAPETPDGTYTFTYVAQTSGDVLKLTPTKAGYDFSAVIAKTITTP